MSLFEKPTITPETWAAIELARDYNHNWLPPLWALRRHYKDASTGEGENWRQEIQMPRRLFNTRFLRMRWSREGDRYPGRSLVEMRMHIGRLEIVWAPICKKDWHSL